MIYHLSVSRASTALGELSIIAHNSSKILSMSKCNGENSRQMTEYSMAMEPQNVVQQLIMTAIVVTCFICTKTIYDALRRRNARVTVVVVGAGPIGMTSILIAAKHARVEKLIVYEELSKHDLFNNFQQIAFNVRSVHFLKKLGVDFDNIEGCWDHGCFYTRLGVFQEYMLSTLPRMPTYVDVRAGTKFSRECLREVEKLFGRKLVIVCDGSSGTSGRLLGLTDEFLQISCRAYGAVAALDRQGACQVPMPERCVNNLHFDLAAYGSENSETDGHPGFSFKLFGTSRHRYMVLAIPKCESPQVKSLRTVLDRSMMRNIFLKCFNTYKSEGESNLSDSIALKFLKFSPRLFDIKLSQRVETATYLRDTNTFVLAEGEAARCYNIHTGMDVNVGIKGLMSLSSFINSITVVEAEHNILKVLIQKNKEAERICKDFAKNGLTEHMHAGWK